MSLHYYSQNPRDKLFSTTSWNPLSLCLRCKITSVFQSNKYHYEATNPLRLRSKVFERESNEWTNYFYSTTWKLRRSDHKEKVTEYFLRKRKKIIASFRLQQNKNNENNSTPIVMSCIYLSTLLVLYTHSRTIYLYLSLMIFFCSSSYLQLIHISMKNLRTHYIRIITSTQMKYKNSVNIS